MKVQFPDQAIGLALLSGLVMGLAPAPASAWFLVWVALVPLWVLVLKAPSWSKAALLGLAWGLGYHGLSLSWITGLHPLTWLNIPWLGSLAIVGFAWGFITLWGAILSSLCALSLFLLNRYRPGPSWLRILSVTAIWCGLEALWELGPLNWTSLSYTQSPSNLLILHLGQLSGPLGITAAIVSINGLVAEGWVQAQCSGISVLWKRLGTALALLLLYHLVGWGLYSRPLDDAPDQALRVGIVQGNVPTRLKFSPEGLQRSIEGYSQGYETLVNQGAEAVLTPEGAFPFIWEGSNRTSSPLYAAILRHQRVAWVGAFTTQGDRLTQGLLNVTGTGEVSSRYNKIKLVPLGEYIPFQEVLGKLFNRLSPVKSDLLPGSPSQRFETPFGQAIASICYESAFPTLFRNQAATGGQFILTASNLDPYSWILMEQHQAQDVMRAIETDRWAARATNTGYSGIVDPHGRILWSSQPRVYALHLETIYRRQTQTHYVQWGNWLTPLLLVLSISGNLCHPSLRRK